MQAISFVLSMHRSGSLRPGDLWVSHHGDNERQEIKKGMDPEDFRWERRGGVCVENSGRDVTATGCGSSIHSHPVT
jgi:hypothetical protein